LDWETSIPKRAQQLFAAYFDSKYWTAVWLRHSFSMGIMMQKRLACHSM
jgi:hypothetical protein